MRYEFAQKLGSYPNRGQSINVDYSWLAVSAVSVLREKSP